MKIYKLVIYTLESVHTLFRNEKCTSSPRTEEVKYITWEVCLGAKKSHAMQLQIANHQKAWRVIVKFQVSKDASRWSFKIATSHTFAVG